MRIELDGIVGLGELEEAALVFGRSAPAQLVADAVESMIADLVDAVVGQFGLPLGDADQLEAPWACTGTRCRARPIRPRGPSTPTATGQFRYLNDQVRAHLEVGGVGRARRRPGGDVQLDPRGGGRPGPLARRRGR